MSTSVGGTLAFADGVVYIGAGDGKLYAIDSATGKPDWSFDTRSSIAGSPMIVDGVVYFGTADDRVWAVDAKTGKRVSSEGRTTRAPPSSSGGSAIQISPPAQS